MKGKYFEFIPFLLEGLIISIILFLLLLFQPKNEFAVVNVNKIVDHYVKRMASSYQDEKIIKENTKLFMAQLEKEIKWVAKEKKVILLVSEAVLSGELDYTDLVQKRTESNYQKIVNEK